MSNLISKADAIELVLTYFIPRSHTGERGEHEEDFVRTIFNALPSADAVQGKWLEKNSHTYICGECGFEQSIYGNINEYNYCPRCGVYKECVDYGGIFPQKRTPYKGGDSE